jgi:hypothetical protein
MNIELILSSNTVDTYKRLHELRATINGRTILRFIKNVEDWCLEIDGTDGYILFYTIVDHVFNYCSIWGIKFEKEYPNYMYYKHKVEFIDV